MCQERGRYVKNCVARMAALGVLVFLSCLFSTGPGFAGGTYVAKGGTGQSSYDVVPYNNPTCGCCVLPGNVLNEMITGTILWTGQPDLHHWYIDELFKARIEPALMKFSDQMVQSLMSQALAVGSFLDAQNHVNSMRSLQKLNAQALHNYSVSDSLCRYASLSKSLAASEAKQDTVQKGVSKRSIDRQMLRVNMNSGNASETGRSLGAMSDKMGRVDQFLSTFCKTTDSDNGLKSICKSSDDTRHNRDIDFTRTLSVPLTLDINFTDSSPTDEEEDVLALANNLYAHDLLLNANAADFKRMQSVKDDARIRLFQNFRSAVAKRGVAENSFAAMAAMKASGTGASLPYMQAVLKEMGLSADDIDTLIGDKDPSYYAQMEVLGRKLYQDPVFYANLMDNPSNVQRQQAALKAISLMQDRDIYDSLRRSEMLFSTLLELSVMKEQDKLTNAGQKSR